MAENLAPSPRTLLSDAITTSSPPHIHEALNAYRAHPHGLDPQTQTWALGLAIKLLQPVSLQALIEEFGGNAAEKVGPEVVGQGWARGLQSLNDEEDGEDGNAEEVEGRVREVLEVLVREGWDVNRWGG